MEITLRKYRADTKQWQCYEVVPNDFGIKGTFFYPLEPKLPGAFSIQHPELQDLNDLADVKPSV